MFILENKRNGSCYFEFQFCKIDNPLELNKVRSDVVEHWKKDSLLVDDEEFEFFLNLYQNIFDCAIFPNGGKGFFPYGINYYDKPTTENILEQLKKIIDKKYEKLIDWLQEAIEKYNGFYILGL